MFMKFYFTFLGLALGLSLIMMLLSFLLNKKMNTDRESLSTFECGFTSYFSGNMPFSLRFYLLANIFLIFDVELIILFPYFTKNLFFNYTSQTLIILFLLILSLGVFQEWNQKMFEWAK